MTREQPLALLARAIATRTDPGTVTRASLQGIVRPYRLWHMQPRGRLGPYYVDWGSGDGDESLGDRRDPVRIAELALDAHARYLATRGESAADLFFARAQWLRDHASDGCYPMPTHREGYAARPGYLSARAQSLAISVLIRADELRPRSGFLDAAMRAAAPMGRSVVDDGVLVRTRVGDTFLEDVAVEPAAHRLDGCVIGCFGLFELQHAALVPWLGKVVGSTIGTLQRRLTLYDRGTWSYETALAGPDGSRRIASRRTHALHVAILHVFASMIDDRRFAVVARAWTRRATFRTTRRISASPLGVRVALRRMELADRIDRGARPLF